MVRKHNSLLRYRLFWRYRPDGRLIRNPDPLQTLMPHLMRTRTESCVYFRQQLDLTHTLEYIRRNNATPGQENISVFNVFIAAAVRTAARFPRLNRFVVGRRVFARNRLQVSYIVKREMSEAGAEVAVKQTFAPENTLGEVAKKMNAAITRARTGQNATTDRLVKAIARLPDFLLSSIISIARTLNNVGLLPVAIIDSDPLFSSIFAANLGSIGLDAPFHHLYEWGTVSIFLVIGQYRPEGDRTVVDVTFTLDERIADGYYFGQALHLFRSLVENPEQLATAPESVGYDE